MKPEWIIQGNMDGVDTRLLRDEVLSQGMTPHMVDYSILNSSDIDRQMHLREGCVVCYGDIDFVQRIRRRASFIPGVWCNFNNLRCSTYYAYLGEHLLNQQYMLMPLGDLLRRWDTVITYFPDHRWFVRPDSGAKPFTGHVVGPDEKYKIKSLVLTIGPEPLVVVSPELDIEAEWRFVVCDRRVVAGCQYLPVELDHCPSSPLRLASIVASSQWQPDLCYTVDIASSGGKMRLLKINSFSCAGFYLCDLSKIVRAASLSATKEWSEYLS